MLTFLSLVLALWFGVTGCYVLVMNAKRLHDAGELSLFWQVSVLPWAVVGTVLDWLFDWTIGTVMFAKLPREWLFTHRVQRLVDTGHGWRADLAFWWARQLNQISPDHVQLPPLR